MQTILTIASATSFFAGVLFLAYAVEFTADKLSENGSDLKKATKKQGGPALLNHKRHRAGLIFSGLGYVLLILSTAF